VRRPEQFMPGVLALRAKGLEVSLLFPKGCTVTSMAHGRRRDIGQFDEDVCTDQWRVEDGFLVAPAAFARMRWRSAAMRRRRLRINPHGRWAWNRGTRIVLVGT
jgi:hypothetical protein